MAANPNLNISSRPHPRSRVSPNPSPSSVSPNPIQLPPQMRARGRLGSLPASLPHVQSSVSLRRRLPGSVMPPGSPLFEQAGSSTLAMSPRQSPAAARLQSGTSRAPQLQNQQSFSSHSLTPGLNRCLSTKGSTCGSPHVLANLKKPSKAGSKINSHNSCVSEHGIPDDRMNTEGTDAGDPASFYDAGPDHPLEGDSGEAEPDQTQSDWTMTDRLRLWRDDARAQHLYETAAFWGAKVYGLTSSPNDAFWLAQVYFLTGQFVRAEKILTGVRRLARNANSLDPNNLDPDSSSFDDLIPEQARVGGHKQDAGENPVEDKNTLAPVRMTDYSTACRYLAAQCMIRQGKWEAAMEMVGDENPFRLESKDRNGCDLPPPGNLAGPTKPSTENGDTFQDTNQPPTKISLTKKYTDRASSQATMDGGIKFESSMCYIRGLVHLQHKSLDRAKECFLESLALDVKCYESFEALVGGNMLEPEEEWEFIQSLGYHHQTPEDALFIKSLYTVRLKKFNHKEDVFEAFRLLKEKYNLSDDPDAAFGLADWLFTNYRFQDCHRITSRILTLHDHHPPTLPLHLSCMAMMPHLRPSLFLLAHDLVERDSNSAISWYAAGLWYFSQKRWEESRRFFSKSALMDSRFAPAWFGFGHALAYEGEHDQAITAYSTASHNFQGSHLPLLFIGMQHIQLANPALASDYLTAASEICPFDPLVLHERGVVHYYQEHWEQAAELFESTIKASQNSQTDPKIWAPTYLNLSHCYRRLKRYSDALQASKQAKFLQPRSAAALTATGMAYHALGKSTEAIRMYHESLAILPADPMTTSLLKFSLDLECLLFPLPDRPASPQVSPQTFPGLPKHAFETWKGDLEAYQSRLDGQYGLACTSAVLLGSEEVDHNQMEE
ncbi:hypothetical protein CROQUDRAFT_55876 [Cronartium quercuum f. sp. fusiforme G11]|uniref:Uncharacterized protein n=1 Tax=Cronartium quercuum f. sp. fusiforme G11 TaxID=708437 RepID=A0A9P6TH64_9BASI|nr:hypothetical protein CROQUDRAFT_55876 [Cronartium quercuum f. sp. fusiforme G11]